MLYFNYISVRTPKATAMQYYKTTEFILWKICNLWGQKIKVYLSHKIYYKTTFSMVLLDKSMYVNIQ